MDLNADWIIQSPLLFKCTKIFQFQNQTPGLWTSIDPWVNRHQATEKELLMNLF